MSNSPDPIRGTVVSVGIVPHAEDASLAVRKLVCEAGNGVVGDRHSGATRLSDVRERLLIKRGIPKGVPIANMRQISIVSAEELLATGEAYTKANNDAMLPIRVDWRYLGANLAVEGIPDLSTSLKLGDFLVINDPEGKPRTTVLGVWDENFPCPVPGTLIAQSYRKLPYSLELKATDFVRHAKHRRGIVGWVSCSGTIKPGDQIEVVSPSG